MAEESDCPKKSFDESYDTVRDAFLDVNSTPEEAARARASIQEMADGNYEAFRTLVQRRVDDGNNTPVIMATIRSTNLAREIVNEAFEGALAHKTYDDIAKDVAAKLLADCMGPLHMMMWDKYIGEQLDEGLKGI